MKIYNTHNIRLYIVALAFLVGSFALSATIIAYTGKTDPLFTNLTTNDTQRSKLALHFSKAMMERGHPVTVFLNEKGVMAAAKSNSPEFAEQQRELAALIARGANVIACEPCMQHYGIAAGDLVDGVKTGSPELANAALLKENMRTMAW